MQKDIRNGQLLSRTISKSAQRTRQSMRMTNLLRIDASARKNRSISRWLTDYFFERWLAIRPRDLIVLRDVGLFPPPVISEAWIDAAFAKEDRTPEQQELLALSDDLINEVSLADIIVIATPMYNYGMPAALKAWFDQVVRVNKTFTFDLTRGDQPLEPILSGKVLLILTSSGEFGFGSGGINEGAGHLVPHIRTCSKYLGAEEIHHIGVEYQEFDDDRHRLSRNKARAAIGEIAADMSAQFLLTDESTVQSKTCL